MADRPATIAEKLEMFGTGAEAGRRVAAYRSTRGMDQSELSRVSALTPRLWEPVASFERAYVAGFRCGWLAGWVSG